MRKIFRSHASYNNKIFGCGYWTKLDWETDYPIGVTFHYFETGVGMREGTYKLACYVSLIWINFYLGVWSTKEEDDNA